MGGWSAIYTYTPEAYPTYLRGSGVGSASCWNRIAAIISPLLGGLLIKIRVSIPLSIFASAFVVAGLASILLPETRGKTLTESRTDLHKKSHGKKPIVTPLPASSITLADDHDQEQQQHHHHHQQQQQQQENPEPTIVSTIENNDSIDNNFFYSNSIRNGSGESLHSSQSSINSSETLRLI